MSLNSSKYDQMFIEMEPGSISMSVLFFISDYNVVILFFIIQNEFIIELLKALQFMSALSISPYT